MSVLRTRIIDVATVLCALCAVFVTGLVGWEKLGPPAKVSRTGRPPDQAIKNWESYIKDGYQEGLENARVTVLEFGDYECPVCKRFHPALAAVQKQFPNDVRFVYRHWALPYHGLARPAAIATECARHQGRFKQFHNWLYENDFRGRTWLQIGQIVGVPDTAAFNRCVQNEETGATVDAGAKDALKMGGRGTPIIIINGMYLGSTPDSATLRDLVWRAALEK